MKFLIKISMKVIDSTLHVGAEFLNFFFQIVKFSFSKTTGKALFYT